MGGCEGKDRDRAEEQDIAQLEDSVHVWMSMFFLYWVSAHIRHSPLQIERRPMLSYTVDVQCHS